MPSPTGPHLRIELTTDDPPKQLVFEYNGTNPTDSTRNAYLESALEFSSKWQQFQGFDVIPYAPIYVPYLLGGRGKASKSFLTIDTHFGVRYIYQREACIGIWYSRPLGVGWGPGTPEEHLQSLGAPYSKHSFCAETMVPVAPSTLACLNRLLAVTKAGECTCGSKGVLAVNVLLELELDGGEGAFSTYLPARVCSGALLKDVFEVVAGTKIRGEFRLTQVPRVSVFVEETYSYRVACADEKKLEDLIWYPDEDRELWLLPFPCLVENFGEGEENPGRSEGEGEGEKEGEGGER